MEHGLFSVDVEAREVSGLLVPWDEPSRVARGGVQPVAFARGAVTLPRDPGSASLHLDHSQFEPLARGVRFEEGDDGIVAVFRVHDTPEGDAWLSDHGEYARLSPELVSIVRDDDNVPYGTASLVGAGAVTVGAFASAALFAIDGDEPAEGLVLPELPDQVEIHTPEGDSAVYTREEDTTDESREEGAMGQANANGASFGVSKTPPRGEKRLGRSAVFAAAQRVAAGNASEDDRSLTRRAFELSSGAFALGDITYDKAGDFTTVLPAQWLGEVDDGALYTPESPLVSLFGTATLTALRMVGWAWVSQTMGGTWAGNKTAIPSGDWDFRKVEEDAIRWANGNDIAREYRDFATPGFFEAYDRANREAFAQWLGEDVVLTGALAAATDVEADNPAGLTIGAGWSALIDGALEVVEAGLTPTGAVVSASLYKSMLKLPASDVLGYLSGALSLDSGTLEGFSIRASSGITEGHVVVVSRSAADVYTLPGASPIRAEALNIGLGGIDVGYFGYGGFLVKNPRGIVDVAPYTA